MGKKAKTGKSRKDKFYRLAKETGYRARSAFKLLQLNRKFEFLQKSRVCIDLCAAPGGWLQVASEVMPVSAVIIGVDLVPIKPVRNCTTFQEDITTEKCRQSIKKELQTWKADVVLHDGAPNVGTNWLHDAFAQAELTLSALKLATDFLRKGGWFVTKVFRSKDYQALIWVFGQMFKKVHATKPQASRNESAEIFVVCQGYIAPDKIDPKFLDPKHVFEDVQVEQRKSINLIHPEKVSKKAEGYAEGDNTLFYSVKATDFIQAENHLEVLAESSEIVIDDKSIANHPDTDFEIKECCKDIKVLGKKELRAILTWRKKMKAFLEKQEKEKPKQQKPQSESEDTDSEEEMDTTSPKAKRSAASTKTSLTEVEEIDLDEGDQSGESSSEEEDKEEENEEEEKIKEQLAELQDEERRENKRKKRKVMKEKRKLRDKMSLNMVLPGDKMDITDDVSLFDLKKIKSKQQLTDVEKKDMSDHSDLDMEENELLVKNKKFHMAYDRFGGDSKEDDLSESEEESDEDQGSDEEQLEEDSGHDDTLETTSNPLVVDLEGKDKKAKKKMEVWFKKDIFAGLEDEEDEDLEIEQMAADYKERGGVILGKERENDSKKSKRKSKEETKTTVKSAENDSGMDEDMDTNVASSDDETETSQNIIKEKEIESAESSSSDSDSTSSDSEDGDSDYDVYSSLRQSSDRRDSRKRGKADGDVVNKAAKDGFEIVSSNAPVSQKIKKLDPVGLAIGEEMIKSSKRRREIIEQSYNRYTYDDEHLPDWFVKDESRHTKRQLPVSKDQIQRYKDRLKAINARPIKKIAEAEARKKKKMVKRLEKARKKAETISETVDVSDREKLKAMKEVYKKAGLLKHKKQDIQYVVAKRGTGKKVSRPPGVKGRFKVVDPRMKKDLRKQKIMDKKNNKKGKKGGKGKGGKPGNRNKKR